ncbi:hypothetical protein NDU88_006904 [Pleurodeles waltl]|uniref:Uncharacterized protein n=1 Tax=Pleurodeles waltl TaxID=8319 RepID=A0AAV7LTV6_PLEWA|nr:hypothetical protein NDU88_006904 [Pleurodeles waltl]
MEGPTGVPTTGQHQHPSNMASDSLSLTTVSPSYTDLKSDQILEAIAATKQDLSTKVDAVAIQLGLLCSEQQRLMSRVTQVESEVTELRPAIQDLEGQIWSLISKVRVMEARAEDYEGRSRCDNLYIVGFPGSAEDTDHTLFFFKWVSQKVAQLSDGFLAGRAH